MKNTHSITDINGLIEEKLEIIQNGATKKEKIQARKEIIRLEKLLHDVDYKLKNGKKDIFRIHHSDNIPMNKKEVLKLIDSVWVDPNSEPLTTQDYLDEAHRKNETPNYIAPFNNDIR